MRYAKWLRRAAGGAVWACLAGVAAAQSAPDVPVRHRVYELLESLDTAGLIDSRLSTIRPLSRTEVARLLLQAHDHMEAQGGDPDDALARRIRLFSEEFRAELDVLRGGEPELVQLYWKPLESLSWDSSRRGGPRPPDGRQGRTVVDGAQLFARLETHGAAGQFSFAFEPELRHYPDDYGPGADEAETRLRLVSGYIRASYAGLDLTAGRLTPVWGPWHPRGGDALVFSDNAQAFTGVSLRTSEPLLLPWFLQRAGPVGFEMFAGRLEKGRVVSQAWVGGMRLMWRPVPAFEASLVRGFLFGGEERLPSGVKRDRPVNLGLMLAGTSDNVTGSQRDLSDQLAGGDLRLRLPLPWGAGTVFSGEFYGEDEAGGLPSKWSYRLGVHLAGLPPGRSLELRAEYSQLHRAAYRHGTYQTGWSYRGDPIGHHVGPGASDVSGELLWTVPWPVQWGQLQARAWGSIEIRGRKHRPGFPGEEHRQLGLELTWMSREGLRLTFDVWWLRIHRVNGLHGTQDSGAFAGLSAEMRF